MLKKETIPEHNFSCIKQLGFKNLFVSGCSFTKKFATESNHLLSWPEYLYVLGGFENLYNCSMPGAGNFFILSSLIYEIQQNNIDPDDSLIIVMLSGYDRDDVILENQYLNNEYAKQMSQWAYSFTEKIGIGITGGSSPWSQGTIPESFATKKYKTMQSRAIENYIYINSIYSFLQSKKFSFVITNHIDRHLPARDTSFVLEDMIDPISQSHLKNMLDVDLKNFYAHSLEHDQLTIDDYHPAPDGHLSWTKEHLLPYICKKFAL